MAIIKCPECGHDVSTMAAACPNCGYPISSMNLKEPEQPEQTENSEQSEQPEVKNLQDDASAGFDEAESQEMRDEKPVSKKHRKSGAVKGIVFAVIAVAIVCAATMLPKKTIHNWTPATCTQPETCTICGETRGSTAPHEMVVATYTEPAHCKNCSYTYGEPLGTPNALSPSALSQAEEGKTGLELEDLKFTTTSTKSYKIVSGAVRNYDQETHYFVKVKAMFYDEDGNSIDIGDTYACGSEGLEHGESAKFEIYVDYDSRIKTARAIIYDYD